MLATRVRELPEGREWEYEVKWDGYRIEAVKHGSAVRLLSRRGTDYSERFQAVTREVSKVKAKSAVLDGEVVAVDGQGQPSFQVLQNRGRLPTGHRIAYYVFDLLFLNGKELASRALVERRAELPRILSGTQLLFSAPLEGTPKLLIEAVRKHKLEGLVAKRMDSIYEPGRRSLSWQKLPLKPRQEFVIGGYRPEAGSLELLLVGCYSNGELLFTGKARQGLNPRKRLDLLQVLEPLAIADCPFANLPTGRRGHWGEGVTAEDMENYIWVKPKLVAQIRFTEWTSGGVLRHAEFAGLREDKAPEEVVLEETD